MANHCYNHIIIEGNSQILARIEDSFTVVMDMKGCTSLHGENYHNLFETPHPLYDDKLYPKFDVSAEYGSRWFEPQIELNGDLYVTGDSAWGPVEALCQKLSKEYGVKITIEYEESGNDFAGLSVYEAGEQTEDVDTTYLHFQYLSDKDYFYTQMYSDAEEYTTWEEYAESHKDLLIKIKDDVETTTRIKENFKKASEGVLL